jgi:hypothetical protein
MPLRRAGVSAARLGALASGNRPAAEMAGAVSVIPAE